jgi:hypothetical protein|tara:strand:- start:3456 stop:3887 length:432 start_codon:yes stop_codon:yes gene_type:complete
MTMERSIMTILVILISLGPILAQDNEELEEYGFIEIKTDSMNVPFFIDGYYVGNHPLKAPVPVLPGFHEVSYIPPDIQDEKVRDNLTEGIKRVYVAENDTLKVFLFYDHYLSQVESLHEEIEIQNYVGISLFGILVYLLLSIL